MTIEAARRYSLIQDQAAANAPRRLDVIGEAGRARVDTTGVEHLDISGLTFRFMNRWWKLEDPTWMHKEVDTSAIRLRGSCSHVRVANCRFEHVTGAVQVEPITGRASSDTITVEDNEMRYIDDGAITVAGKAGQLNGSVRVMRNRLFMVGLRPSRQSSGHALEVRFPPRMEIAGNMLMRCYGAGIFLFGGKGGGTPGDVPLARYLVYQNKAEQTLLAANDWGGIETWQGGPFYIFNNISANPNGYWNWSAGKAFSARLGYAYYLDGSHKNYLFNNIAWGNNNDPDSKLCNKAAFQEATPTILNRFVNNTAYRFAKGANWSPRGGYHAYLGNVWSDISSTVFTLGKLKEDKSASPTEYPHELMAFGNNVFYGIGRHFGHFENLVPKEEKMHDTFGAFQAALEKRRAQQSSLGVKTDEQPLREPAERDMRPARGSAAIDNGVTHFVPWGLASVVGEWHFYPKGNAPAVIPDEHWFMTDYYGSRTEFYRKRRYPLTVVNGAGDSYVQGPLESWIDGALELNGEDRYAVARHAAMSEPIEYEVKVGKRQKETRRATGAAIRNPDIHTGNFILEVYAKIEPGQTGGVLVQKMSDAGYALTVGEDGAALFTVRGAGRAALGGKVRINDGEWHHILAECDRAAKRLVLYVDGRPDAAGGGIGAEVSLSNGADLLVGGTPDGKCLAGAIDFLRISRGTLADAHTTIEELYAWQFDGPFLRDFVGREPIGPRDAGALEGGTR